MALGALGALGTVAESSVEELAELPAALVATTEIEYETEPFNPVIVQAVKVVVQVKVLVPSVALAV